MTAGLLTLGRWIEDRGRVTPDRVAIDFDGRLVTYRELDDASAALSSEFGRLGLRKGDRVAVLADNCPEYVVTFFACARSGLILTPLNWRLASRELAFQIEHSGASLLVVSDSRSELAAEALEAASADLPVRLIDAPTTTDNARFDIDVDDDDPLFLIYTSGTTGRPKGAVLTHANCFWTNTSIDRLMDVTTFDVVLQILPQFHIGGWNVQPLLALWKGATIVLERYFDAGRALALIESKRVTTLMGVPANYLFMSEHETFETTDLSSLRMAVVGGAPMPESLIRTWMDRGVALVQGYGLSEASPNVLGLPPEYAGSKIGFAGKAYPHVEVALRGESGEILAGEGSGELLVRGPNVFPGYWNDPDATEAAMEKGWLRTGDVAECDLEGFYRIRGRAKDMYISGGENVYPAEVESVLVEHPDVVEAAVLGVPDERWGEVGVAVVVVRQSVKPDALIEWCKARIATFKVPHSIRFADSLPRSGMDKVLKGELAARLDGENHDI